MGLATKVAPFWVRYIQFKPTLLELRKGYGTNYGAIGNILSAHCSPHCLNGINLITNLREPLDVTNCFTFAKANNFENQLKF